jgi:hypothetical protein
MLVQDGHEPPFPARIGQEPNRLMPAHTMGSKQERKEGGKFNFRAAKKGEMPVAGGRAHLHEAVGDIADHERSLVAGWVEGSLAPDDERQGRRRGGGGGGPPPGREDGAGGEVILHLRPGGLFDLRDAAARGRQRRRRSPREGREGRGRAGGVGAADGTVPGAGKRQRGRREEAAARQGERRGLGGVELPPGVGHGDVVGRKGGRAVEAGGGGHGWLATTALLLFFSLQWRWGVGEK